jgi:hypothetical protein
MEIDQALTDQMLERALTSCAEKKFSGDIQQTEEALRVGRCDVCSVLSDSLTRQVGECLGLVDRTVRAVYKYEPEHLTMRPLAGDIAQPNRKGGINLVAWVDRKSAALNALGNTLETLLTESRRKVSCRNAGPACYTLDIHLVDNKDIQERRGYGMVVNSTYVHSTPVWLRDDLAEPPDAAQQSAREQLEQELLVTIQPDLTPEIVLLEKALALEKMPPLERLPLEHHLREIKVTLIRRMISDQLAYINIAKEWFTVADLADIHRRKIGFGKIGGKAAGMLLAARILSELADEADRACILTPQSFFLGSDVMYLFMAMNGLIHWNDQKYKPEDRIRAEYGQIREEFQLGEFPPEVLTALQAVLEQIGLHPVIVRSSSQLEDNFGTAFAGKYDSHFCPNQGTPEQNLQALTRAIALTYASTFKPEALLYRRSKGLQDYDERMAILIQEVQGETLGRYFLPEAAGVAFSRNIYRWAPQIRREAGFARLVWGLGTRAVERVANDYPRAVALSHPTLQPDDAPESIRRYSQQFVDLIDLEENAFKTLPVSQVLRPSYPALRFIAQLEQDGMLSTPRSRVLEAQIPALVITFDEFLRRTNFAGLLMRMLSLLEDHYHGSVDLEFTAQIVDPWAQPPQVRLSLLQCRPQSYLKATRVVRVPKQLLQEDIVFSTRFIVPQGYLSDIRYVLFVPPEAYFALSTPAERREVGGLISRLNAVLGDRSFICVGPGRWGTTNPDLGIYVYYSDICRAGALVEVSGTGIGPAPEPSLGTHFFQDLMEAQIYPLAINLDDAESLFNRDFFYKTTNSVCDWIPCDDRLLSCIRLIDVGAYRPGHHLEIVMDDEKGVAVAFLSAE